MGRSGSRARRDRPSKKPTPLPQRRRPHANQIKGRSRLVVRPAARTRVTARTPHRGRAAARRRSRCRARECTGRHAALLLSSMPSFLCWLFMHQASRAGKQDLVCFQCNAFCLKREQAEQPFVFLNTIFLSKRNIGVVGTWGVATIAAAKAAGGRKGRRQQQQHGCLCHTAKFSLPPVSSSSKCSSSKATPHGP